jgi:hypothetical protein
MEDVAASDAVAAFQVERRQHLLIDNNGADVGYILFHHFQHAVIERLALHPM